jgi:sugar O-acyltransferase (sialic acid O-acetyltransferase NeuD family)
MSKLYIVGTAGLAREIADTLRFSNLKNHYFCGFISETESDIGTNIGNHQVVGSDTHLPFNNKEEVNLVIGIGRTKTRSKVANFYEHLKNCRFPNVVNENAQISPTLQCGYGNIFLHQAFVSTNVSIGNFNLFNWFVSVGHDATVGSGCVVNPHAHLSGYSKLGDNILIGTHASVLENCSIVSNTLIGAGAVVTRSITIPGTYIGIPAKQI